MKLVCHPFSITPPPAACVAVAFGVVALHVIGLDPYVLLSVRVQLAVRENVVLRLFNAVLAVTEIVEPLIEKPVAASRLYVTDTEPHVP